MTPRIKPLLKGSRLLNSIVASLPVMAEYVSSIPDGQKATALDALEKHYLQTALGLGYSEEPARSWVAALMAHLREQLELMSEPGPGDGRPRARGHSLLPRLRRTISISLQDNVVDFETFSERQLAQCFMNCHG